MLDPQVLEMEIIVADLKDAKRRMEQLLPRIPEFGPHQRSWVNQIQSMLGSMEAYATSGGRTIEPKASAKEPVGRL